MMRFQLKKYLILWWKSYQPSRSVNESALDDLKGATMFSDKGVQMKILILSLNGYMKTRD